MRFWLKNQNYQEGLTLIRWNHMSDRHIRSRIKENKKKKRKTHYCKITGSKPPLDFQRLAHCTGQCMALVPFVSSMASIFRVGYEARYTVSHSSFRSVLPGKCSIIRKITRDVEEAGHERYARRHSSLTATILSSQLCFLFATKKSICRGTPPLRGLRSRVSCFLFRSQNLSILDENLFFTIFIIFVIYINI